MSQADFGTMDPVEESGTELASHLNAWRTALHSTHRGASRPAYAIGGTLWINDATSTWSLNVFDGVDDILIGTLNSTTNVFTPSFGALSGVLRADGSGGVAAATASELVAVIGSLQVAEAGHADTADSAGTATTAGTAAAIGAGAVDAANKVANNVLTLAKLARTGTAGKPLVSGGPGADFYVGDFPTSPVTSVGGYGNVVTAAQVAAAAIAGGAANPALMVARDHANPIGAMASGHCTVNSGFVAGSSLFLSGRTWSGTGGEQGFSYVSFGSGTWRIIHASAGFSDDFAGFGSTTYYTVVAQRIA